MKQTGRIAILFACFLLGTLVANASAQLEIHPRLFFEEQYTDNLFLRENNESEDWVTTIEPGISLIYAARSVDLTLDYSLRYVSYLDNSDRNIDKFEDIQRAVASAVFFSGRPFTLTLGETITREALDLRDNNAAYNDLTNRSTVYRTSVIPEYRLELTPSFSILFGYNYDRRDYTESAGNDSEIHTGTLTLNKELSSNTEVFVRSSYRIYQSDNDDQFAQQDYTLGITQQFGPRLTATIEGGYSLVEYDDGLDTQNSNWLLDVNYRVSEAMSFAVIAEQSYLVSITRGLTDSRTASLSANYAKRDLEVTAELFLDQLEYVRTTREDDSLGTRFYVSVPLTRAFSVNFDAEYEWATYKPGTEDTTRLTTEDITRLTLGASLEYEYRRFIASLGYRYRSNDSDTIGRDYTNNIILLSASMRF